MQSNGRETESLADRAGVEVMVGRRLFREDAEKCDELGAADFLRGLFLFVGLPFRLIVV